MKGRQISAPYEKQLSTKRDFPDANIGDIQLEIVQYLC